MSSAETIVHLLYLTSRIQRALDTYSTLVVGLCSWTVGAVWDCGEATHSHLASVSLVTILVSFGRSHAKSTWLPPFS